MKKTFKHHYISLADILANGVVIMIILIVLSLSIKQYQQDNDIMQADEVGAVLSRNIASCVVMNKLPSSGPARLHNYNHPRVKDAPLITLDGGFLLLNDKGDGNTLNWAITRDELLIKNNRLDTFLNSLNKTQRQRIRADIVDIDLFYLVMSIVKEHNIRIRHWHFDASQKSKRIKTTDAPLERVNDDHQWQPKKEMVNGLSLNPSGQTSDENNPTLAPLQSDFSPIKDPFHLPQQQNTDSTSVADSVFGTDSADALFEAMKQVFAQQRGVSKQVNNLEFVDNLRFSFAGESERHKLTERDNPPSSQPNNQANNAPSLFKNNTDTTIEAQLIDLLLSYLNTVQNRYDAHYFVNPSLDDFIQNARQTNPISYQKEITQINDNVEHLTDKQALIPTHYQQTNDTTIALTLNRNLESITLNAPSKPDWLADNNTFTFNLYAQPTIDKNTVLELNTTDIVLIPYAKQPQNDEKWLAAAILNAQLDTIHLGFIYGTLNDNKLLLANSENDTIINNQHIVERYQSNKKYHALIEIILYALLALSVLLWLIKRR